MEPRRYARTAALLSVAGGGLLVILHFVSLFFDLPAGAANLSPFDVSIFEIEKLEARSLAAVARDPEWIRVGIWILFGAGVWAVLRAFPRLRAGVSRAWDGLLGAPEGPFVFGVVAGQLALSVGVSCVVFSAMPHVQDEIGQFFQARIFAAGALFATPFRYPDFFSFYAVIQTDKWYSQHPPGLPLLLAPFLRAGVPWLLNPLLGSACTLLVFRLGKSLFGGRVGRLAALLMLFSPFHAFMSGSFMNHTPTLFFLLVSTILLVEGTPGGARGGIAGFSLGLAILTRPLVGLALGSCLGAVGLWRARDGRGRALLAMAIAVGLVAPIGFFLWYNAHTNGGPLTLGYSVADPAFHRLGFANAPVPYSPGRAWIKTAQLIRGLDAQLFAWPLPSLLPVWLFFMLGRARRRELLVLAAALVAPFAYFFYWFQDMCLGPRFAYESSAFFVILVARSIEGWREDPPGPRGSQPWMPMLVLVVTAWSLAAAWPPLVRGYATSYWGTDRTLTQRVEEARLARAVVIVGEEGCPWYYGAGFWANEPDLGGDVVYARDLGVEATRVLSALLPGRAVFRYDCRLGLLTPWEEPVRAP